MHALRNSGIFKRILLSRIIQVLKPVFHEKSVWIQNFAMKSHFGVFTHWILCKLNISLYSRKRYEDFVDFKWEIPDYIFEIVKSGNEYRCILELGPPTPSSRIS